MTQEQLTKLIRVCENVSYDVEKDAKDFDGQPFNGKTIGTLFGNHGAAIAALSSVIKTLILEQKLK